MLPTHRLSLGESLTPIIIQNGNYSDAIGEKVGILEVFICEIHFESLSSLWHIIIADSYHDITILAGSSFTRSKAYATII